MWFPLFLTIILGGKSELSSSISGTEWRKTEEEDLAPQFRSLENGALLLQEAEKIKLSGRKGTNKDPLSEEVGIHSSPEARAGVKQEPEDLVSSMEEKVHQFLVPREETPHLERDTGSRAKMQAAMVTIKLETPERLHSNPNPSVVSSEGRG